ncbi:MAG: SRPBCC family protein [Ktedonobacteraceae bacterium]
MREIHVKAEAVLDARPEDVYAAIADYRNGHPNIIPKVFFSDLQVEQGGYGAGTIIRFKAGALGAVKSFRQRVTEPEPGRVLVEQDIDPPQNITTTFTVIPVENERKAHVKIATTMKPSAGLAGMVERLVVPKMNARVYRKELRMLEAFAQRGNVQVG